MTEPHDPLTCELCHAEGTVAEVEALTAERDRYRAQASDVADAADRFMQMMDALENPRPAASWFALKDAVSTFREALGQAESKGT